MKLRYLVPMSALVSAPASETETGKADHCAAGLSARYAGNPVVAVLLSTPPVPFCPRSSEARAQDVFIKGLLRQDRPLALARRANRALRWRRFSEAIRNLRGSASSPHL
jgi:hypothetical protein